MTESILGFDLFTWEKWSSIDEDVFMFSNVTFIPASLRKFNGNNIEMSRNGDMVLCSGELRHEIDLFEVPEFVGYLTNRIKIY